jgi:hypothetical protein
MGTYIPEEIIKKFISYDDTVKYRNGVFMKQIPKDDKRYALLQKIRKPHYQKRENGNFHLTIYMIKINKLRHIKSKRDILKVMYIFSNYGNDSRSKYKDMDIVYYYRSDFSSEIEWIRPHE